MNNKFKNKKKINLNKYNKYSKYNKYLVKINRKKIFNKFLNKIKIYQVI